MIKLRKNLQRALAGFGAALAVSSAAAQHGEPPRLSTNETYIAELARSQRLAADDPMAVFSYVLGSLPERAKVYPTENHYYFSFDLNGIRYAGNIKIDARLRAEGKVVFSYYEDRATWLQDTEGSALVLGPSHGVTVEKVEPLAKIPEKEGNGYEVNFKAKGAKLGDVAAALQTVFEKKSEKAVTDVQWFAPEKKKDC